MSNVGTLDASKFVPTDEELGQEAARMIFDDAPGVDKIVDPRTPAFAKAVIEGLAEELASSKGAVRKMMKSAAIAAEDLNVGPFQGLIEVIQNADDLRASEVRFALRDFDGRRQLLLVHNGKPVECQNVLGMALPFFTTKTNRTDQRGRFGIGLKTLKRIADSLTIHSAPYHFSGDQLSLAYVDAEAALPGFYDPTLDTLVVLELKAGFNETELQTWFEAWEDDGLIFLTSVGRFRWCSVDGTTIDERTLAFGAWVDASFPRTQETVASLKRRSVGGEDESWTVWKATVKVPAHLSPAHKAKSDTTDISIAMPDAEAEGRLYIGFKTRVPVGLPFSFDAQFDPSTAREALIENEWNNWLIERCADVLAEIAAGFLVTTPTDAWRFVPLANEHVGNTTDEWLREKFGAAFVRMREELGSSASVSIGGDRIGLSDTAYEDVELTELLSTVDIEALVPASRALTSDLRDAAGRWRKVMGALEVATLVGTTELLSGFERGLFVSKGPMWWVYAARLLVENHPDSELFDAAFWLSDDSRPLPCYKPGATKRPLVFGGDVSTFSARWQLLDRLHPAYGISEHGETATDWLENTAAFVRSVDAETELAAFAERFASEPLAIEDADLRDLRDRFHELSDRRAAEIGARVGKAILLEGFVYKKGKLDRRRVSPAKAYLCRTLDSDAPNWPEAAGTLPDIEWIQARYDDVLKTGGTRTNRRQADGTVPRGPRKFLMLLGVATSPRLELTGEAYGGTAPRVRELRDAQANHVYHDYTSPDLQRVLSALPKMAKKDAKRQSPALMRALARNWDDVYAKRKAVPSGYLARTRTTGRANVTASWLLSLREAAWVAVGKGELAKPSAAVIKTLDTQARFAASEFAVDIEPGDVGSDIISTLRLITSVRVSDWIEHLRTMRDGGAPVDQDHVMQVYRNIAKHAPRTTSWLSSFGDLTTQEVRKQFAEGLGLVYVGAGQWRRPGDLLRGKDIFHDRQRFVPGGPIYAALWIALDVREPSLDDCLNYCRSLSGQAYDMRTEASLIDVYRYMEPLLSQAERRHKERLKLLPLSCFGKWATERPLYFVEDEELRGELAKALPSHRFWTPPCDTRELPNLVAMIGVTVSTPTLSVIADRDLARDRGEDLRVHFGQAVDNLNDELARNDPMTRERISLGWDRLRAIPLYVYDRPIAVSAQEDLLSRQPVVVELQALLVGWPLELHICEDALPEREFGGRAIASLFPPAVRRKIDAEWLAAWQKGRKVTSEALRLASDEAHIEAMEDQAAKINAATKTKMKVSQPASRTTMVKPRTLKESVGAIASATVLPGSPPKPAKPAAAPVLPQSPPQPSQPSGPGSQAAPIAYSTAELEQRGWEILVQTLNTSADVQLVDFRKRHGVGADGAIDWSTFVEMKASGRTAQTSISMTTSEYLRAKEKGNDFILALVYGLEDGERDEIRLIFNPATNATLRPTNGVRLIGLTEAPCVHVTFGNAEDDDSGEQGAVPEDTSV